LKIHFLGTGTSQGIPVIGSNHPVCHSTNPKDKRLRVSIWLEWENASVVIDCGPDFRQQMLTCGCTKLDAILFTHEHSDHTAGIDEIRPFNFLHGDLPIYANGRVLKNLKKRFDYIFETENRYAGAPAVKSFEISENQTFKINEKIIIPIKVMHGNLPILGFRIDDFAYLTDVKTVEPAEVKKLFGIKTLVINALRIEPHNTHFNLNEALAFIDILKPEKTYLTHISHVFGYHDEIQKMLPENVFVAYDNLILEI
jgi:phosphoribosyl 1,2-cyclic phosphate phosphodiesterase